MLRIGQIEGTATADKKYTDGSVAGGVAATRLRAAAFNAMQEELAHIVESTDVELDINDMTQVLTALQKLFAGNTDSLGALGALVGAADKLPYFTKPKEAALTAFTEVGRNIVGKGSVADVLTYLGISTAGHLIKTTTFASTQIFHAQPTTKFVRVRLVGAGAASGAASATGASQNCVTCPGGLGVYAEALFFANFDGVLITIGTGGQPRLGNGFNGGDSSFGSLLVCPGGIGSLVGSAIAPPGYTSPQGVTLAPTIDPAGLLLCSEYGQPVNPAIIAALGVATNYHQIYRTKLGNAGIGGTGQLRTVNASQVQGVAGFDGECIVEEYS